MYELLEKDRCSSFFSVFSILFFLFFYLLIKYKNFFSLFYMKNYIYICIRILISFKKVYYV